MPRIEELMVVQPKSQSKGTEVQLEATKLLIEKTEPDGPELNTLGLNLNIENHEKGSEKNSKSKVHVL